MSNKEILDDAFRREDLPADFHINRYSFRFTDTELIIKEEKSKSNMAIWGALLFGGMGVFFGFITVNSWMNEGFHPMAFVTIFFTLFGIGLATMAVVSTYYMQRMFVFDKDSLLVTKLIGKDVIIQKSECQSVFIKHSITRNQYGSVSNESYDIYLRKQHFKTNEYSLFNIEEASSLNVFLGESDAKTEEDAVRIGKIISDYWKIPFSV